MIQLVLETVANTLTVDTSELVGGLHIPEVLDVSVSDDGNRHAVFDGSDGFVMDRLVAFVCCPTVNRDPGHSGRLGLLTQIHCLPQVLMDSVGEWRQRLCSGNCIYVLGKGPVKQRHMNNVIGLDCCKFTFKLNFNRQRPVTLF